MIWLILVLGLVLRLIGLRQSLWLDEAIGALAVRDFSYTKLITDFLTVDNHPPLYYLLLKFWTEIFGYSEISLRMPSVLFGVGTVYLIYIIGKKVTGDKLISTLAALFLATSQFHIYYSQEARMYCLAAFFASLAVYSFLHLFDGRIKKRYWLLFSSTMALMVFTDYMPVFILPAFFVYAVFKKRNKHWWYRFLLSFTPIIIAGLLWLPVFQKQSAGGTWLMQTLPEWKTLAGGANIKQLLLVWMKFSLGRISLADKSLYYLFTAVSSIPFAVLMVNALKSYKKYIPLFLWLLLPLTLSFLVSIFFPAFIYFRLLYLIPAFYLIAALGVGNMKSGKILAGMIIALNIISSLIYYTDGFQKRENWRGAVSYVEKYIKDDEVVLFSYPEPFAPYRWYEKKTKLSFGATDSIKADALLTAQKTFDLIKDKKGVYYFEYLSDLSDPSDTVFATIKESGLLQKTVNGDFNGVGMIYHFVKL